MLNVKKLAAVLYSYCTNPGRVTNGYLDSVVNAIKAGSINYEVYTAFLNQSGTDEPIADIRGTNDLGEIVWSRTGAGNYVGTLEGAFPDGRTFPCIYPNGNVFFAARRVNNDTINVTTVNTDLEGEDDNLSVTFFEIRIYPAP